MILLMFFIGSNSKLLFTNKTCIWKYQDINSKLNVTIAQVEMCTCPYAKEWERRKRRWTSKV